MVVPRPSSHHDSTPFSSKRMAASFVLSSQTQRPDVFSAERMLSGGDEASKPTGLGECMPMQGAVASHSEKWGGSSAPDAMELEVGAGETELVDGRAPGERSCQDSSSHQWFIRVRFRKRNESVRVHPQDTVGQLSAILLQRFNAAPPTQKLIFVPSPTVAAAAAEPPTAAAPAAIHTSAVSRTAADGIAAAAAVSAASPTSSSNHSSASTRLQRSVGAKMLQLYDPELQDQPLLAVGLHDVSAHGRRGAQIEEDGEGGR